MSLVKMPALSEQDLIAVAEALEEAAERRRFHKMDFFIPYPKQDLFMTMGADKLERLLMAGTQNGKTECGAFEAACHLTGLYPDDWLGRRFNHPVKAWAAGISATLVRDAQQNKLCGTPGVDSDFGTGFIPRDCFHDKPSLARGATDAYDTIQVKHHTNGKYDGTSTLGFKSYEQGRGKFQAATLDFIWFDEEPPQDIYTEGMARTTATGGMGYLTFTPLLGMSDVVLRFLNPDPKDIGAADRGVITMTIDDALHIAPEERAKRIASFPAHERDARARGVPMQGEGRIFQTAEDNIKEPTIQHIPLHWKKLWGVDFGIAHPFAAVLLAWDVDIDVIHILHCIRISDKWPLEHAAMMKPLGANVPVAWPQDGTQRDKGSGVPLSESYKAQGLLMLPEPAMWSGGGNSTEAGVLEMQTRFETGRLKVAAHLSQFFDEYRLYHRKDGQIVKSHDDILSATRIGIMAKRFARAVPLGGQRTQRRNNGIASGLDFDLS
jgi:phage terminase large subunit-like protein